jgi:hypothetical protein
MAQPKWGVPRHDEQRYAASCKSLLLPKQRSLAVFKKVNGADVTLGLVAAAFFVLAYAVETKAILVLESSQDLFEVIY